MSNPLIDSAVQALIEETESYLRDEEPLGGNILGWVMDGQQHVRPAVPVVPGPLPNSAVIMVECWTGPDDKLILALTTAYKISEATARLWIHMARKEYR